MDNHRNSSTKATPISQIKWRLEDKPGDLGGTRRYWDCVEALLDVAEAAQRVLDAGERSRSLDALNPHSVDAYGAARLWRQAESEMRSALGKIPQKSEETNNAE